MKSSHTDPKKSVLASADQKMKAVSHQLIALNKTELKVSDRTRDSAFVYSKNDFYVRELKHFQMFEEHSHSLIALTSCLFLFPLFQGERPSGQFET